MNIHNEERYPREPYKRNIAPIILAQNNASNIHIKEDCPKFSHNKILPYTLQKNIPPTFKKQNGSNINNEE